MIFRKTMRRINRMSDLDIQHLKNRFIRVMRLTFDFLNITILGYPQKIAEAELI